ncbi:hypothetical protein FOZ62_020108 [Perkinsus olseni]|uniref:Uncharacterized protein n=1 Tax=Perkinsus olseni TaxID=32597 RepID=A0A7J6R6C3_PEROL|nr:hypothetical protein FOZ62_020108 [Perkinsus olseni]
MSDIDDESQVVDEGDPRVDQCAAEIAELTHLVRAQQRRLDAQELLIEELCQARCDVCLAPETATRVFSQETRQKKQRDTLALRASIIVSAIMFGVVSKVMYSHYQLQYCFELFYKTTKASIPELEDIDFTRLSPLYFSPISATDATTAPVWFLISLLASLLSAFLQFAAVLVDRILRTIVIMSILAGGVVFVFKNFDSIVRWFREDKGGETVRDHLEEVSGASADIAVSSTATEVASESATATLPKTQWSISTDGSMERSMGSSSNEEESTTSTIGFTGPVTRRRAKAFL